MSKYHDVSQSWDAWRARCRERVSRIVPRSVMEYPFEVMVGIIAVLMGLPFLIGTAAPASLIALVGTVAFYAWAAALTIGGVTVLAGLRLPARPNPLITAAGLQLAGGAFGVYSIAIVVVLGTSGWAVLSAYVLLCIVSMIRASHFRRILDIQKGATRLQEGRQ